MPTRLALEKATVACGSVASGKGRAVGRGAQSSGYSMYSFTQTDEKNNEPEPVTHVRECRLPAVWPEHEVLGTSLCERL